MIYESYPWKCDIATRAARLRRRKQQKRWPEASFAAVERDIFLSAYAVRKLIESNKISDEVQYSTIRAGAYQSRHIAVDFMNRHDLDSLYDLSVPSEKTEVSLLDFCNQIIHSFVFCLAFDDNRAFDGLFVASDRDKEQRLLHFEIDTVMDALERIANDDIVLLQARRVGGVARITRKSSRSEVAS